jgi:hypothetical protein
MNVAGNNFIVSSKTFITRTHDKSSTDIVDSWIKGESENEIVRTAKIAAVESSMEFIGLEMPPTFLNVE